MSLGSWPPSSTFEASGHGTPASASVVTSLTLVLRPPLSLLRTLVVTLGLLG